MALGPTVRGYLKVGLSKEGKCNHYHVNTLVAGAFYGPRPDGMESAHRNGVKTDNRAENLAWKTHADNERDKWLHGTVPLGARNGKYTKPECTPRGESHGQSRLTEDQVIQIRKLSARGAVGAHALAKLLGVSKQAIQAIVAGHTWSHV